MCKFFFLWLLPLIAVSNLQAQFQEGYLVTADGDSLAGFVSFSEYARLDEVAFKKEKRGKAITYQPSQVKAFGPSHTSRVVSLSIPLKDGATRQIFIRQLVGGRMDMFVHKGQFFIRENGDVYVLLHDRNVARSSEKFRGYFKDVLEEFFSGCISAENAKYEETSLRNLINNYNRCHRIQPIVYRDQPRGLTIGLSVFAGAEKSDMVVDDGGVIPTNFYPTFGAGITLHTPVLQERLFFDLRVNYGKRSGNTFMEKPINSYRRIYSTYDVEFDVVRVPFGVGYYLTDPARSPVYVKGGLSKAFMLSSSFDYIRETESFTMVTTEAANHRNVIKGGLGLWGSLGIEARIRRAQKGFLEIRWEKSPASIDTPKHNFSFDMTNVGLYAGLLF
jgi:hypothetical protein